MATEKKREPRCKLVKATTGELIATWELRTLRFMLNDGTTIDVVSTRDDSDVREAVLIYTKCEAIAGVVTLPYDDEPEPKPIKRVRKRAATPVPG